MFKIPNLTRKETYRLIANFIFLILGSFLLSFGTAIFQTKLNIVAGGVTGIGIIIQSFVGEGQYIDIVVAALSAVCWIISLIFIGKKFAFKTLLPTILIPLFLSLFLRIQVFMDMADTIAGDKGVGNILLCALFGGAFTGAGLALTFIGGGSTGGTDVFVFLLAKHTPLKESTCSFLIDSLIILLSMFLIKDNVVNSLCGFLCSLVCALMIDYLFVEMNSSYQADIISTHWEEISQYVQDEMGRGVTIIPVKGGYKHTDKIMIRTVFDRRQLDDLKKYISAVDSKAFVTYTKTYAVYGEGFTKHGLRKKKVDKDA